MRSRQKIIHKVMAITIFLIIATTDFALGQRRITPINTIATATQPINENANDTARINAKLRATMAHYHDENGNIIYVDTITGKEWRDSTAMEVKIPMKYPLLESVSVGVNIWDPVMRIIGQRYGIVDFLAQISLHNRYKPTVEIGFGAANSTPEDNNFTYKSPLSIYYKVGIDYNFLYNSSTDYQFFAGARLGISPFSYSLTNISIDSDYWGETARPTIPSQHTTVLWCEFGAGLHVKLWGPISAGWTFKFHSLLKEKTSKFGQPWYIPGYGARGNSITGAFHITFTIPLNKKPEPMVNNENEERRDALFFPETTGQPTMTDIENGLDAQTPGE